MDVYGFPLCPMLSEAEAWELQTTSGFQITPEIFKFLLFMAKQPKISTPILVLDSKMGKMYKKAV